MAEADYPSIKRIVDELLTSERSGNETIVRLPLIMSDGSNATVRVIPNGHDVFVGDIGLAHIRAESLGSSTVGFANTAKAILERFGIQRNKTELYVRVPAESLYRAICDVGMASWQIADSIAGRSEERAAQEFEEEIGERLIRYFGREKVDLGDRFIGQSQTAWDVTAIVKIHSRPAIFQAVTTAAVTVYKAKAAFHDISVLPHAPKLIAVVKKKEELGNKLSLLSQEAYVLEEEDSPSRYQQAAA